MQDPRDEISKDVANEITRYTTRVWHEVDVPMQLEHEEHEYEVQSCLTPSQHPVFQASLRWLVASSFPMHSVMW